MRTIITVQHTESVHHTNGMIGSWTDWDITPRGVEQAERIGKSLADELARKPDRIIASDLLRAKHTAQIVAKHFNMDIELDARLKERNLGEACGKSVEWARANTLVWERTVDDCAFRGGESRRDVWHRLKPFLDELMATDFKTVILVSHGDTLCLFNLLWLGLDLQTHNSAELFGFAGGVSLMQEGDDGKRRLRKLSDMSYQK